LLFFNRRYEEALAQVDAALRLAPDFPSAYRVRCWVKIAQKKFPEAIAAVEKGRALASDDPEWPGLLGYCYAAMGRANDAQQQIERLKANFAKGITVATTIALVYQGLGDKEQVFARLERAASNPYDEVLFLKYTPIWDEVTADPRYAAAQEARPGQMRRKKVES
jgi:tetratricopeptide (TPR) repeat protein